MMKKMTTALKGRPLQEALHLYHRLRDDLKAKERLALATVIFRSGSGPREPGAAMIIHRNGEAQGTVGGGRVEAKTLALAEDVLQSGRSICFSMALDAQGAAESGMICGGRVEMLIEYIDGADPVYLRLLNLLWESAIIEAACRIIRSIEVLSLLPAPEKGGVWVQTGWGLMADNRFEAGSLNLPGRVPEPFGESPMTEAALMGKGSLRYFIQPVVPLKEVLIIGAGHVGQALAALCPKVGFKTVIIDDRGEFAHRDRFPEADDIRVPASLKDCFSGLSVTRDRYIVIMTRGHAGDQTVLAQALRTEAGYIGMIGSKTKRDAIYRNLLGEGFTAADMSRVHSPIGLPIGARTPAEIAVSILAELIAVRSGNDQR